MKLAKNLSIWLIASLLSILLSCKEESEVQSFFTLSTSNGTKVTETLEINAEGLSEAFVVKSNGAWKIVPAKNSNWISVHPDFGNGDGSFNLSVEENETLSNRETELSCSVNGEVIHVLKLKQNSRQPHLSVSPSKPEAIEDIGGEIEFTVDADAEWEYTLSDDDWLKEKSKTATSLVLEVLENKTASERSATISFSLSSISEITQDIEITQKEMEVAPVADLFDISFKTDGTADDLSPYKFNISTLEGAAMTTVYSNRYERYVARFSHNPGDKVASGFYRRDYSIDQDFRNKISEGHTLEALFMLDLDAPLPDKEIKMFSSHQSGGTGLMIGNNSRGNSIIFLPHVGGSYIWANSNVTPQRGKYYHVVGVWNKKEGKAQIYVDGDLKTTVNASGNFKFPTAGSDWFGIGADPTGPDGQTPWTGDIVLSRAYSKALSDKDVEKLWNEAKEFEPVADDIELQGVRLLPRRVQENSTYTISGSGFQSGDKIKLAPLAGAGKEHVLEGTSTSSSFAITIPNGFETGKYRFYLVRGGKEQDLGFTTLTVGDKPHDKPQVIAHRGYWKAGVPQNSVASLIKAQELNIYGSEFDVWITTDDVIVLNHDATIEGIQIENVSYSQLKDITLSNGEKLPTLEQYLEQGKKDPSTKLILEIKTHKLSLGGVNNNDRVAEAVVEMVKDYGMTNQVEYILFNLDGCKKILELQPDAVVAYLNGDRTPQSLHEMGIKGIDYKVSVIKQNKHWIAEAQNLGMTVNVWTANSQSDLLELINDGVDFITTDEPVLAIELIEGS